MSTIAMWFDGGDAFGFGNIRRSLELGARLAKRGHVISWRPLTARAARLAGLPFIADVSASEFVVLDLPYEGDRAVDEARSAGSRILALDYSGAACPDLAVSLQAVRSMPQPTRSLVGLDFAIIREEFLETHHQKTEDRVLVIVGGGDSSGLTEKIVERLAGRVANLTVVSGPLGRINLSRYPEVEVRLEPSDLSELMARCRWAVTSGGTTMLEFLSMGKPVYVIPRTEAEIVFARRMERAQALLGVGLESLGEPDEAALVRCAQRGPELIDGRGCERIAELLEAWQ